jgi:hypothetical protein
LPEKNYFRRGFGRIIFLSALFDFLMYLAALKSQLTSRQHREQNKDRLYPHVNARANLNSNIGAQHNLMQQVPQT